MQMMYRFFLAAALVTAPTLAAAHNELAREPRGIDASVTRVDSLFSMWTAATHKTMSGRVLGEDERISIPEALHAVTLGAAYLLGQDDKKGSIEAGKLADFTILDRNPLEITSPDELRDIKVLGTVMGGKPFPMGAGR